MRNITMTMNAVTCVASSRLRAVNTLLAAVRVEVQGTRVSFAAPADVCHVTDLDVTGLAPFGAGVDLTAIYKTPDVARSRSGRPPV